MYIEPITIWFVITNTIILLCYLNLSKKISRVETEIKLSTLIAPVTELLKNILGQDDDEYEDCDDEEQEENE